MLNRGKVKVLICYRVLQAWRVPVFERLSKMPDVELLVLHGQDYQGTKLINYKGAHSFRAIELNTIKFSVPFKHGAGIPIHTNILSEIYKFSPDVIITEGASNFFSNFASFLYAKIKRKKIVQWGLGEIEGRRKGVLKRVFYYLFGMLEKRSDAAISYSTFGAKYYKRCGLPNESIFVAVNVVDTDARKAQMESHCLKYGLSLPSVDPDFLNVIYVGALAPGKNVEVLIKAYSRLVKEDLQGSGSLLIIGDGPDRRYLESLSEKLEVDDRVTFLGHISGSLAEHFYRSSVMVMPGLGGLAVSDSLSHGVPVICGVGDGCEKDLIDGSNGIIINPFTEDSLFEKLLFLSRNPHERRRLRSGAAGFLKGKHNIESYVNELHEAIFYAVNKPS
ncbi:glycosyltransferase family 4 protein [Alcanivorax xiamenensis]|uniref:glycosyltransferase family 4 protein n=1 Tax=Alcanivorax xiamenensis TaxID=1177156 RepID=UPI00135C5667|nr:glycosyltransferase [Alcanivorax xiamenensis]